MKLLIVTGYAGAGKSTISLQYAKKHDFALINQDHFLFKMNPSALIKKQPTKDQYDLTRKTLLSSIEIYMEAQKNILLEGALISIYDEDPISINEFVELAKKHDYETTLITLVADSKIRKKRQLKRGNTLNPKIDQKLIAARENQAYSVKNHIIDTSKQSKRQTLANIEGIMGN